MRWLRALRDDGHVALTYSLFSLEVNATDPRLPYEEAAPTYGPALAALALARREEGDAAFEALYVAIGTRLHERKEPMSRELLEEATKEAGLATPVMPVPDELAAEVVAEYRGARERDVFGVPTLGIDDDKVVYGPILAVGPTGTEGVALWEQVKGLADRDTFFELKRWPRDVRPGGRPTGPADTSSGVG
jgi:hypothetical protein